MKTKAEIRECWSSENRRETKIYS